MSSCVPRAQKLLQLVPAARVETIDLPRSPNAMGPALFDSWLGEHDPRQGGIMAQGLIFGFCLRRWPGTGLPFYLSRRSFLCVLSSRWLDRAPLSDWRGRRRVQHRIGISAFGIGRPHG